MSSLGERLYRRLLRLYPPEFREEYGQEMATLYRDRARAEPAVSLWFDLVADLARTAPGEWCSILVQDLRYAVRLLRRTPVFAASAILTLALGIGANTAIFSLVHAVLLAPLPYPEPDRLVQVWTRFRGVGLPRDENHLSPPELRDLTERARSFSQVAAYSSATFNLVTSGEPERVEGAAVSPRLLQLTGVRPVAGRLFTDEDSVPGRDEVVLVSHGLWQRRFGGDAGIVGRTLRLDGRSYLVAGVLPATFEFPERTQPEVLAPLALGADEYGLPTSRGNHWLRVIARLAPGVSLEQASGDMQAVSRRMIEANPDYPYEKYDFGIVLTPLRDHMVREARPILWLLMGSVALVLLVACINIVNLLLVRASTRGAEMSIRRARGAGPTRLLAQMITESVLLAACGGAAGLLLGACALRALKGLAGSIPHVDDAAMNLQVLAFTAVVTVAAGILFGITPALRACRHADPRSLRSGGRRATGDRVVHRLRHGLVIAQVALSLVMLVCAGLLTRSLVSLLHVDPGFRASGVLTMRLTLTDRSSEAPDQRRALFEDLLARVRALPGVEAAGAVSDLPLRETASGTVTMESRGEPQSPDADLLCVTPEYFDAMGIRVIRGRPFDSHDRPQSAPVAIVDEALARTFWPGEDPLGKRIKRGFPETPEVWMSVVGVVAHVRQETLERPSRVQVYWPYAQGPSMSATLVVRASGDPSQLVEQVRQQVISIAPTQPVHDIQTMDGVLSGALARRRVALTLMMALSALALTLAAVGLYGVLAYAVSQRAQEFGLRAALGATPARLLRTILAQGVSLAALGCAVGIMVALPVSRAMQGLLYGVGPLDPLTFSSVLLLLLGVALIAAFAPARRAARVDPVTALRCE